MLSPNTVHESLPPVQSIQQQPPPQQFYQTTTVPNSPSMGRYPSIGVLPDVPQGGIPKVNNLPPGFLATGPVTPLSSNAQLDPGDRRASSTTPGLYGPPQTRIQRSASSTSSRNDTPQGMHSRSRSVGGQSFSSVGDEMRSKTPGAGSGVGRPSSSAGRNVYPAAPTPAGVQYPAAPGGSMSPRSAASRLSGGGSGHHQRSFSLNNAGSTPAAPSSRPLSTAPPPKLRRVPSDGSVDSAVSGMSRNSQYERYRPSEYVDPAFLASSEDLTGGGRGGGGGGGGFMGARKSSGGASMHSPALSYASLQR